MNAQQFLKAVWPEQGPYVIAIPDSVGERKFYRHYVKSTVEKAAEFVELIGQSKDVFFGVHSLKQPRVWDAKKVNSKTGAQGAYVVRTGKNMAACKALYLDLDVGEGPRKYASQQEALVDLRRFCKETRLPKPLMVSSGGGIHVYWLMNRSLPSEEWRELALQLKELTKAHDLKADPARTADMSSVLRVAGSWNLKSTPLPVRTLSQGHAHFPGELAALIRTATVAAGVEIATAKAPAYLDDLGDNTVSTSDQPPPTISSLLTACHQLRRIAKLGGDVSEPEWYHALNAVRFVEDGHKYAHKVSQKHPKYTYGDTQQKLEQLEQRQVGPTTCQKLAEVCGEALCGQCRFNGAVKSPVVAARAVEKAPPPTQEATPGVTTAPVALPDPPEPFKRRKGGGIVYQVINRDNELSETLVYDHDLYPVRRVRNLSADSEEVVWRVNLPHDGEKDFVLEADVIYDGKKLAGALANQGVYLSVDNIRLMQGYMSSYIAQLQKLAAAEHQYGHFGWTNERKGFVMPSRTYIDDGSVSPSSIGLNAQRVGEHMKPKGTLEKQIELLKFYDHPNFVANQFFILCSLAAPIFYATGYAGVVVNASGRPGASKSTSLYTAASFWGNPDLYALNGTNTGATPKARFERVTTLSNLPVCVDEITHMSKTEAKDLAMGVTQPAPRLRLSRSGVERAVPDAEKSTIMMTTANSSLHNALAMDNSAGTAGSMRVVEIDFVASHTRSKAEADDFLHQLRENYGHIGEIFIAHVVRNKAAIEKRVRELTRELDAACRIQSSERYWSATGAVVITTAEIAYELGLLPFDPAIIKHWFIHKQVPDMRGVVSQEYSTPISILTDYIEKVTNNMVVVQNQTGNIAPILRGPKGEMLAHYNVEEKVMWVLRHPFRDYCSATGASMVSVLKELNEPTFDATGRPIRVVPEIRARKVLGAGTEYAKSQSYCFVVNMAHPDISSVTELVVVPNKVEKIVSLDKRAEIKRTL